MPGGLADNNPCNLRVAKVIWTGQIPSTDGFSNFSSLAYGIRAWIVNLRHQVNVNGLGTYQQYLSAYAPSSENSPTYPADVCGSDFNPTDQIALDPTSLQTLFFNQMAHEISADDAATVQPSDFQAALDLFTNSPTGVIYGVAGILPDNYAFVILVVCLLASAIIVGIKAFSK